MQRTTMEDRLPVLAEADTRWSAESRSWLLSALAIAATTSFACCALIAATSGCPAALPACWLAPC